MLRPPQGGRSYKAIMLNGGADSFNMLVPHSNCGDHGDLFQGYAMLGTSQPCLKALCCRSVSPQACSTFGLREKLEELYDAGEALWLANVGAMMGWGEMGRDGEVAADFQVAAGCHPRHHPPPIVYCTSHRTPPPSPSDRQRLPAGASSSSGAETRRRALATCTCTSPARSTAPRATSASRKSVPSSRRTAAPSALSARFTRCSCEIWRDMGRCGEIWLAPRGAAAARRREP